MSKFTLNKRSENVNKIYSEGVQQTEKIQAVEYGINDENGNEIGSANVYESNLNLNIYSGINSIEDATAIVEKMFGALAE